MISPRMLNDFRVGYNRIRANQVAYQTNTDFTHRDLGLDMRVTGDGNRTLLRARRDLPNINIASLSPVSVRGTSRLTRMRLRSGRLRYPSIAAATTSSSADNGETARSCNEASNLPRGQLTFSPTSPVFPTRWLPSCWASR